VKVNPAILITLNEPIAYHAPHIGSSACPTLPNRKSPRSVRIRRPLSPGRESRQ
jgi:hypothetical protein